MTWYTGITFLKLIETIDIKRDHLNSAARFPVQTIILPQSAGYSDYRGYAGRVAGGTFKPGDEITVLPSLLRSKIKSINVFEKSASEATIGESVTLTLEDQIDISRGDLITGEGEMPLSGQDIRMMLCWFNERPLRPGARYLIRNNTHETACIIKAINYRMNIETLEKETSFESLNMNDIANVSIKTSRPIFYDPYKKNRITGSLIIIDEATNETMAAGMIDAG
jgi:sulfate adenylyltransferase subunit 1